MGMSERSRYLPRRSCHAVPGSNPKFLAKARTLNTGSSTLLLHTNFGAGHGGAAGRYDALHDVARDYAFLLTSLGRSK